MTLRPPAGLAGLAATGLARLAATGLAGLATTGLAGLAATGLGAFATTSKLTIVKAVTKIRMVTVLGQRDGQNHKDNHRKRSHDY
jgi:hypothetical protein